MSEMCGGGGNAVGPPQLVQAEVWWWLGDVWVGGSIRNLLNFVCKNAEEFLKE